VHLESIEHERLKKASAITVAGGISNGMLAAMKIDLGTFTGHLPFRNRL